MPRAAMSPTRALTIALMPAVEEMLREDVPGGNEPPKVAAALIAARLATRTLKALPPGWGLADIDVDALEGRVREMEDLTRLLLASRIQTDGHAETLSDALRIASDIDRVRALYPELQ